MTTKSLIRRGDLVQLVTGSGSGRIKEGTGEGRPVGVRGRVKVVMRKEGRAIVEGMHVVRKALKPDPKKGHRGGIVDREAPVRLSNLMLVCRSCDRPVRTRKDRSKGKARRVCTSCGKEI